MTTGALVAHTAAFRIPRPRPGLGHYGHHGFGGFGHIGSFLIHMAIWHMIFRTFSRAPGLIGLVLVVGVLVFGVRRLSRRRFSAGRIRNGGWSSRRW